MLNTNTSSVPRRADRSRSTAGWISGSDRRGRLWTKWPRAAAATANPAHVHQGQPASRPSARGRTSAPAPTVTSNAPSLSTRSPAAPRVRGSAVAPASEASTTGTVSSITGRQPRPKRSALSTRPPIRGPASDATAMVAPYRPRARGRRVAGVAAWMSDRTWGATRPLPAPCTSRAIISDAASGAHAPATEPAVKTTVPVTNRRR